MFFSRKEVGKLLVVFQMLKAYFFRSRSRSQRKKTGAGKKRTGSATLPVFIQMGAMLITRFLFISFIFC